jgi:transketolase
MGGILNGMALHGGVLPFGSTFLIFSDYMRPAIRLAALMKLPVIFVYTHDSVALGEDGPTHQPVEQISGLRAVPNLTVIRPADANEVAEAWKVALQHCQGPVALLLTRQALPVLDRARFGKAEGLRRGGYVLADSPGDTPELILIATGSEIHPALDAFEKIRGEGCRVRLVNLASWEIFEQQPREYKDQVLPPGVSLRISVEAAALHGWHKYVGSEGKVLGIDHFGASAPGKVVLEKFGFTADNIYREAKALLKKS